jgi:tetratricopeptide (TPR) repeat protein
VAAVRWSGGRDFLWEMRLAMNMKRIILLLCTLTTLAAFTAAPAATRAAGVVVSPAEQSVAAARTAISQKPTEYAGYNLLATALVRRAQETSDVSFYAQAEDALKKSLAIAANNFDAEKIQVWILLGEHEYPAALAAAQSLNQRVPDDVMIYGWLTDADVELGNYEDAETSAQWMLNLRPGNLPALTRASHLRELFGDAEGAYELMDLAYQSTAPTETEERASILTEMGHLRFASGKVDAAEKLMQQALTALPGYAFALGNLAQLRLAQKRYPEAVVLLQQRYQSAPRPGNLYELAEALQLAGRDKEAAEAFAEFEGKAVRESGKKDNCNRELIFYWADHAQQPAQALKLAQQEFAWRHDVYTRDAYAWALHVNGQNAEAHQQMQNALAVGIRDAKLFLHAGAIALSIGDIPAAERYLRQSGEFELNSPESEQARHALAGIAPAPAQR